MSDDNKEVNKMYTAVKVNKLFQQSKNDDERNFFLEAVFFTLMAGSFAAFSLAYWSGWNGNI